MKEVVEKFCNFSFARDCCEDMRNLISYVNSKYGENPLEAKSYIILGGLSLLIFVLIRRIGSKPKPKPKRLHATRSFIISELHSGYPTLNRLVIDKYEHPSALDSAFTLMIELQKDLPDFMILQEKVRELEMGEQEEIAEKILERAVKEANEKNKPHEAYEFEMLLVEVLIYKGGKSDLENGLKCECLGDESLKDARRPLYKAIIYKMQGYTYKAREQWEEFIKVRDPTFSPDLRIDFDQFNQHVSRLQNATQMVMQKRKTMDSSALAFSP
ncbi:hypothetical protein VNO78_04049 [Psophocarpus tetragonolobus]|uniref:Uncharacterized protein n=1 Tax=Psophocarpus tetragonolobus TaxID=3891 RepID=A0AAN9XWL4_PSOTE